VESDVWRSKFLASTLIVEELTRSKHVFAARCEELEHGARFVSLVFSIEQHATFLSCIQGYSKLCAYCPLLGFSLIAKKLNIVESYLNSRFCSDRLFSLVKWKILRF
jgi:hypothetical protein